MYDYSIIMNNSKFSDSNYMVSKMEYTMRNIYDKSCHFLHTTMTDIFGDIRVRGNNPIGTAPTVTNTLYVTKKKLEN